jgi:hypothetical protein
MQVNIQSLQNIYELSHRNYKVFLRFVKESKSDLPVALEKNYSSFFASSSFWWAETISWARWFGTIS